MNPASEAVRKALPLPIRSRIRASRMLFRQATSRRRPLPSFLILGAQRAGTTSLYKYLARHPNLSPSLPKETNFWSQRFQDGMVLYRSHFELRASWAGRLAFESTPNYLFHPLVPVRVAGGLPDARFIVLLRDPVQRAYSHYRHSVRYGLEELSFEEAVKNEPQRLAADLQALERNPAHACNGLFSHSYAARGRYAEQLARWFAVLDPDQFLILRSEDFFSAPAQTLALVEEFLEVTSWRPKSFPIFRDSSPPATKASQDVCAALRESLNDDVGQLEEMIGRSMDWKLGRW